MTMKKTLLSLVAAFAVGQASFIFAAEEGFKSLFNGKDLAGWAGRPQHWSVEDGAITGRTTKEHPAQGNNFLIWTNGTVSDFELRLSYKIVPDNTNGFANSGIQYRSRDFGNFVVGGYQADFEAGKLLSHFHACGSDRGTPGNDHIDWKPIAAALKAVGYKGDVVIESFTTDVKVIARAAAIWRRIEPTRDEIAVKGLRFLKRTLRN